MELRFHEMKDYELLRTSDDHNKALTQPAETAQQMFKFKDGSYLTDLKLIYPLKKKKKVE